MHRTVALISLAALCLAPVATASMDLTVYAASDAQVPGLEDGACFNSTWYHAPVVNRHGEVAFFMGVGVNALCNSGLGGRPAGVWLYTHPDLWLVASRAELGCSPPCPLTTFGWPSDSNYGNSIFDFSDNGDLLFLADEPSFSFYLVKRDCSEDAHCASGACHSGGVCECASDADCPSNICIDNYCELRHGPVIQRDDPPPVDDNWVFGFPYAVELNAHGVVVFRGGVDTPDAYPRTGLFRFKWGEPIEIIALEGEPLPGEPDLTFGPVCEFVVADDEAGTVAFMSAGRIWINDGNENAWVAKGGAGFGDPQGEFISIDSWWINMDADGYISFLAEYNDAPWDLDGIFVVPPGTRGATGIGAAVQLTDPEGFRGVESFSLLGGGTLAYIEDHNDGVETTRRIRVNSSTVVSRGDPAPQEPWDLHPYAFLNFDYLISNNVGQFAFKTTLEPHCSSMDQQTCEMSAGCTWNGTCESDGANYFVAVYIWDEQGGLRRVAMAGDLAEVSDYDVRTISNIYLGLRSANAGRGVRERSLNDSGKVCMAVNFEEGGTGMICTKDPPVVRLVGLEVNQSVQDWNNSVPLVADKRTIVRAHVGSTEGARFEAQLRGWDVSDGAELPGSPLAMSNPGGVVNTPDDALAARKRLGRSAYWDLPEAWTRGQVRLKVESTNPDIDLRCEEAAGPYASDCEVEVRFEDSETIEVKLFEFRWTDEEGYDWHLTRGDIDTIPDLLKAQFPVANVDVKPGLINWFPFQAPPDLCNLALIVKALRKSDNCEAGCERLYVAVLDKTHRGGCAWAYLPNQERAGTSAAAVYNGDFARYSFSHEIGHLLGRHHAAHKTECSCDKCSRPGRPPVPATKMCGPCCSKAGRTLPDFPFIQDAGSFSDYPALGPLDQTLDDEVHGVDTQNLEVVDPRRTFELMSYCRVDHRWPSSHTYLALLTAIRNRFPSSAPPPPPPQGPPGDHLLVRGLINETTGEVTLFPINQVYLSDGGYEAGDHILRLLDDQETVLEEISFALETSEPSKQDKTENAEYDDFSGFLLPVPVQPGFARIELVREGQVLATLEASPAAPTVQITSPNGGEVMGEDEVEVSWSSSDADGDSLWHRLRYSPDGGQTWTTLALDWPGQSYSLPRRFLTSSEDAVFEVQVSDGFHTATDTTDAPFGVTNNPPWVRINRPRDGELFAGGQRISLSAWAQDLEDGPIPDAAIEWTSSLDGQLLIGRQGALLATDLSEGDHLLTVTATDFEGASGNAQVNIRVQTLVPADLADLDVGLGAAPSPAGLEQPMSWTATVNNLGPEVANGLELVIALPADATFQAAEPDEGSCEHQAGTVTCSLTQLAVDVPWVVPVDVVPTVLGSQEASALVSSTSTDPIPHNDSALAAVEVLEEVEPPDAGVDGGEEDGGDEDGGQAGDEDEKGKDGGCKCGAGAAGSGALALLVLIGLLAWTERRRRTK